MPEVGLPISDIRFFIHIKSFQRLPPLTQGLEKTNMLNQKRARIYLSKWCNWSVLSSALWVSVQHFSHHHLSHLASTLHIRNSTDKAHAADIWKFIHNSKPIYSTQNTPAKPDDTWDSLLAKSSFKSSTGRS